MLQQHEKVHLTIKITPGLYTGEGRSILSLRNTTPNRTNNGLHCWAACSNFRNTLKSPQLLCVVLYTFVSHGVVLSPQKTVTSNYVTLKFLQSFQNFNSSMSSFISVFGWFLWHWVAWSERAVLLRILEEKNSFTQTLIEIHTYWNQSACVYHKNHRWKIEIKM